MPPNWLARLKSHTRALVPSRCAVCHAWPSTRLCNGCVGRFAQPVPRCGTCARMTGVPVARCGECLRTPPPLDACLAAVGYEYPWSGCITDYKFGGDPGWASALATLLRSTPWVEPALESADLLLPMPLSAQRLQERGFNQAQLLARALSPTKIDSGLLLRIRDTVHQTGLDRAMRMRNLRGAFAVEPLRADVLRGKRVVLVDDVMTSGASLHTAAAVLRQAGVAHITGMVVARTEAGRQDHAITSHHG